MLQSQLSESMLLQTILEMGGITKDSIEQTLENLINEAARPKLLFWDLKQMAKATPFCEKTIEQEIIKKDPRFRQYQRRNGRYGKKVWLYEPTSKLLVENIMNNWEI
ncbi:hypothetical protein [Lysinibacillus xylanilyticus]|uniref:hypothetical protein n=1 Tax=Lysinibacillus xylanilyticus TaxID=582475 RepID=UPI003D962790